MTEAEETRAVYDILYRSFVDFLSNFTDRVDKKAVELMKKEMNITTNKSPLVYMFMGFEAGFSDGMEFVGYIEEVAKKEREAK